MSATDRNLIARIATDADADAFSLLVDRHRDMVFAACSRILGNAVDAEEAAQICFFRLFKNASSLRGSAAAWLHGVAVHVSIDMIRRAKTRRVREKEAGTLRLVEEQRDWGELRALVDEEIAQLSESRRTALVLHYLQRRPQREIAEELGVTQPRVSQLLNEALTALRKAVARKGWSGSLAVLAAFMAERTVEAAPTTLTAALGKMAMAGIGSSVSTGAAGGIGTAGTGMTSAVAGKTITGGIAMKLGISTVIAAAVISGVIAVQSARSQNTDPAQVPPKILSMTPANGAMDVDPGLKEIKVVFDRPMKWGSWAMVGGGPHCPKTEGQPYYDETRTTWTVPVSLEPDWNYEFRLNSEQYRAFRSEAGVPLEPVLVTFTTATASASDASQVLVGWNNPLVQDVLMMHKWAQEERKEARFHIDYMTCQAYGVTRKGMAAIAALMEIGTTDRIWSAETRTLKIGITDIGEGAVFYDLAGNIIPHDVERVTPTAGFFNIHFPQSSDVSEHVRFIMTMELPLTNPHLIWKEGNLWHVMPGNQTPRCLDYYSVELPESSVLVESWPQPFSTQTRNGRTVIRFRRYSEERRDNRVHVAFLWPDKDQTSVQDLPPEYRGLRDSRDVKLAEEYERRMAVIREASVDMEFGDLSTPVTALLTWQCAMMKGDVNLYTACHYTANKNPDQITELLPDKESIAYFVDGMTFLSTPEWPEEPEEGYIHPVYMAFPGTLMRRDVHAVIFHEGQWMVLGNMGNYWDTDISVFEKFK